MEQNGFTDSPTNGIHYTGAQHQEATDAHVDPMSSLGGADETNDIAMSGDDGNNTLALTPHDSEQVNTSRARVVGVGGFVSDTS